MKRHSVPMGAAVVLVAGCLETQELELPSLGTHHALILATEFLATGRSNVRAHRTSSVIPFAVPPGDEGIQVTLFLFDETLEELGIEDGYLGGSDDGSRKLGSASEIYRSSVREGRFADWHAETELSPALDGFRFGTPETTCTFAQTTEIDLGIGSPPLSLIHLGDRRLLVPLERNGYHRIDLVSGSTRAASIPGVTAGPGWRDDGPDGPVWIAGHSGGLTKLIEMPDGTFTSSIVRHPRASRPTRTLPMVDVAGHSSTSGLELFAVSEKTEVVWYPPGAPPQLSFSGNPAEDGSTERRIVSTGPGEALVVDHGLELFQVGKDGTIPRVLDRATFTAIGDSAALGSIIAAERRSDFSHRTALFRYDEAGWTTLKEGLRVGVVTDLAVRGTTVARVDKLGFLDIILDADLLQDAHACAPQQLSSYRNLTHVVFVADREVVVSASVKDERNETAKLWRVRWEE